jgi:hypothetical protein
MVIAAARKGDERVDLVVSGCRRDDLRRCALRECTRRFGAGEWCVCEERFRPAMVSRAGSVRLWEGRFELTRSA